MESNEVRDFTQVEMKIGKGRKRIPMKQMWRCEQLKAERHKSKRPPRKPNCNHAKKMFKCKDISMQDVRRFHEVFYSSSDKITQDHFILKYIGHNPLQRWRPGKDKQGPSKNLTITYFIKLRSGGSAQVCAKSFLSILGISKTRVQNVAKEHMKTGLPPVEKRGGARKYVLFEEKRNRVRTYIKTLKCVEQHYTRKKSTRQYFPSDWSKKKLWRAYNNIVAPNLKVKYHFFWEILMTDFNIGLTAPSTDACSECLRLKTTITTEKNSKKKHDLITLHRVHKLRARAFYNIIKDDSDKSILKILFDCEKNLVLPKVPDQAAYYSRQLYQCNMTLCEGGSKTKQTKDKVNIFAWCENERKKGSNEISSIVYHYLTNNDLSSYRTVQLFADGCPGQNKNMVMVGMIGFWFNKFAPPNIKSIQLIYPIVGHSYLPPDRVFGNIERVLKKKPTIILPSEYREVFERFGQVKQLGQEIFVYDWKAAVEGTVKAPGNLHFKFSKTKVFTIKKLKTGTIMIKGEPNYRFETCTFKPLLKPTKSWTNVEPEHLPNKVPVKAAKIKDVKQLLRLHFGDNWEEQDDLIYYKNVIAQQNDDVGLDENEPEEVAAELENMEEDIESHY